MPKKAYTLKALACALGFIFIAPQALAFDNLNQDVQKLTLDPKVSKISAPFILIDDDDDRWDKRRPPRRDRDDRWEDDRFDDDDDSWEQRRPPRRDHDDRWDRDDRRFNDRFDDDRFDDRWDDDDRWDNDDRRERRDRRPPPRGFDNRHHPEPFHRSDGFRHHRESHHFFL